MYDARQEPNEFVADNLEEAKEKAAEFFGSDASDLKVVVPADGEIFGATSRTVIIAVPKDVAARGPRPSEGGGRGGDDRPPRREGRGDRGPRRDRGDRGESRGGRRERGGGRGEGRGDSRGDSRREGRGESRGDDRGENRGAPREKLERQAPRVVEDSKGTPKGDIGPIGEFLVGALERMKLGSFEISKSEEGNFLIYQIDGAAAEALQSGDGRATDALQLVANQVSMRQSDDAPRIVVDVEGGGDEREETLGRLADRAVKRARETGRSIALDPMNSRDRRLVHVAVRDTDGIATMSIGEGRYRQVLVVPEGAPEYDEAVSESS